MRVHERVRANSLVTGNHGRRRDGNCSCGGNLRVGCSNRYAHGNTGVGPQFHEECLELQPAEIDFYRREMVDGDVEDPD